MATILDLQDRGLRYGVIVDAAATTATLAAIERAGLRYKVEVASGITAADRAILDRRGLQYFVPVAATVSMADRAILERQGLRYAVQVDPTVLPADLAILERQGLSYFVEVDSSGNAIATAAGGAILLTDEANGFATDFTHAVDAERVAVKTAGTVVASTVDGFFTNAGTSPKMVYDSAGVLGWSPHNTCLQSQTFDNVSWAKNAFAVTANAIAAPDGTMTADACIPPVGANSSYINQPPAVTSGTVVTFSVYIKDGTLGAPWFLIQSDTSAWFNLATGIKGTTSGGAISSNMIVVGNGWYRCDMTFTAASGAPQVYLALALGDGVGTGLTGGDGVKPAFYLWGAQLNKGSVATTYLPTTTAARFGLALDYDPVTHAAKGLLCEPAATNLMLYSAAFDNSSGWVGGAYTASANATTAPNGLSEADAIIPAAGPGRPYLGNNAPMTTVTTTVYTFSVYAKNGTLGSNWMEVSAVSSTAFTGWFNLATGVKGTSTGSPLSYTMTDVGNGWYRLTVTFTAGATATTVYLAPDAVDGSTAGVTGDGTSPAFHLWGAQCEVGTVATSLIPTTTATVTRAVDNVTVTTAAMGAGWSAAGSNSLVINAAANLVSNAVFLNMHDGTDNERYVLDTSSGTKKGRLFTADGNVTQTDLGAASVPATGTYYKTAFAVATNDFALSTDGGTIQTDAVGTLPTVTTMTLGGNRSSTTGRNIYIKTIMTVPRRMTNPQLVTAST